MCALPDKLPSALLDDVKITMGEQDWSNLLKKFLAEFSGSFALSGLLTLLPTLLKIRNGKRYLLMNFAFDSPSHEEFSNLLQRSFGMESVKFGAFVSVYFLSFRIVEKCAGNLEWCKSDGDRALVAGIISSFSLLFQDESTRASLSLYVAVRAGYSMWMRFAAKSERLQELGPAARQILFMLLCAQTVFTIFRYPEALEPSYRRFIESLTRFSPALLEQVRFRLINGRVSHTGIDALLEHYRAKGHYAPYMREVLACPTNTLGCELIHPRESCCPHLITSAFKLFPELYPLYFVLSFVPRIVFSPLSALRKPKDILMSSMKNAARTSLFMVVYAFIGKGYNCVKCNLGLPEEAYQYWILGFLGASSFVIESRSRQIELLLFMVPKLISSVRALIESPGHHTNFPVGSMVLFSVSMGIIMKFFREEPEKLSPLVRGLVSIFMKGKHQPRQTKTD